MLRSLFALCVVAALVVGCSPAKDAPEGSGLNWKPSGTTAGLKTVPGLAAYSLGDPIESGNVTLVPVVSNKNVEGEDTVSLTEAQKNGWVVIEEAHGTGQVNALAVTNKGPKTLLLLGGELLIGGKQDRIVSKDTLVPPGKSVEVPVFCVEHGRWEGSTTKFEYSGTAVPESVREEARNGDQVGVWRKVGDYNTAAKADASRSTVQAGIGAPQVRTFVESNVPKALEALRKQKNVVGMLIAVNGEVRSLELFGQPSLFQAASEGLLKGYFADAAVQQRQGSRKVGSDEFAKFMVQALDARRTAGSYQNGVTQFSRNADGVNASEAYEGSAKAGDAQRPGERGFLHGAYSKAGK